MSKNRLGLLALILAIFAVGSISLAACARPGTPVASTGGSSGGNGGGNSGGNTVHMGASNFLQTSVTISKGSNLTLVNDVAVVHFIKNGTYVNGTPKPLQEPGAPKVDLTFNTARDSKTIGPFSTAGTFHLYCTVHLNMDLTITVK